MASLDAVRDERTSRGAEVRRFVEFIASSERGVTR